MGLERLLWFVTCLNHVSFSLLTVARRGSCGLMKRLILFHAQSLVFYSTAGDVKKFPWALGFESLDPFLRVSKQGPCFTAIEENGGDKSLSKNCVTVLTMS